MEHNGGDADGLWQLMMLIVMILMMMTQIVGIVIVIIKVLPCNNKLKLMFVAIAFACDDCIHVVACWCEFHATMSCK